MSSSLKKQGEPAGILNNVNSCLFHKTLYLFIVNKEYIHKAKGYKNYSFVTCTFNISVCLKVLWKTLYVMPCSEKKDFFYYKHQTYVTPLPHRDNNMCFVEILFLFPQFYTVQY